MAERPRPVALTRRQATATLFAGGVVIAMPTLAATPRIDVEAMRAAAEFAMSF